MENRSGISRSGQLKRIGISGGAAVVICAATNPFGVSWGPDNMILFGQPEGIMRVSANGGTPELVIKANDGEADVWPAITARRGLGAIQRHDGLRTDAVGRGADCRAVAGTGMRTVVVQGGSDARYFPTGHLVYALEDALFAVAFDVDQTRGDQRGRATGARGDASEWFRRARRTTACQMAGH